VVARQAEAALVIAHDPRAARASQFVALERLQVPVAVRGVDVVAQAPDPVDAPEAATAQLDELIARIVRTRGGSRGGPRRGVAP
jgi:hypothetical protein